MAIKLPTYKEADDANDDRDAIAEFVWNYEPSFGDDVWRKMLQAALDEAYAKGTRDVTSK